MSIRNPPAPLPNAFEELDRVEPPRHKKPEAQNADFRRGGEDVGNNGSDPNALWSVPKDIETSLLPVPQMREEMLPELLSRWLLDVAKRMQCPIDLLASAAVVMFGSLVGTACRIRPKANDSWEEPPNFYGGVVSPPGTMKSPALAEIFRIIERLEVQAGDAFKEAMRDYEIALAEYEASRKKLLGTLANPPAPEGRNPEKRSPNQPAEAGGESAKSIESIREKLRTLAKPEKPVWKRFKVTNATPEKLHEIIQQNPRGAFCAPDELAGLIEQWDAPGHETARGLFLQGFNGKGTYPLDRIIRGTVYVRDLCISVFGGIQPALLVNYLRNLPSTA